MPWFLSGPWVPFLIIGLMFYLLLIRPEQRKRAQMSQMLGGLKKNDHVVTVGGIHGVVVNAAKDSEEVTIRVDENNNTRLRVLRSAISRVVREEGDVENQESD
jgi:preprotein translocase subunit YajC